VTDDYNEYVTRPHFLKACFDWLVGTSSKILHRVVLKLEAPDGIEHAFTLLTQVAKGTADEDREGR